MRKAKEASGRIISATSITLKKVMAALEKGLGIDLGRRAGLHVYFTVGAGRICWRWTESLREMKERG